MLFAKTLEKFLSGRAISKNQRKARRGKMFLNLHTLEERAVPATLTVNSLADSTTSNSDLTLREAILLVNNGGIANTPTGLNRELSIGVASETTQINTTEPFGVNDTIVFATGMNSPLSLTLGALPIITTPNGVTIDGSDGAGGKYAIDGLSGSNITGDRIFFLGWNDTEINKVTGVSWSGGTATIIAANSVLTGQTVRLSGMTPATWNGDFVATAVAPNRFTVAIPSDPGTATVLGWYASVMTGASWSGGVATITGPNSFFVGQSVDVAGVDASGYNGRFLVTSASTTQFTYAIASDPGTATTMGTYVLPASTATNFTIKNLTLQNANARGGAGGPGAQRGGGGGAGLGGALFVNAGIANVDNVDFTGNRAVGGAGGSGGPSGRGGRRRWDGWERRLEPKRVDRRRRWRWFRHRCQRRFFFGR